MLSLLITALCSCSKKEVVKIGYKDNTEQLMLAHLFAKSVEKQTSYKTILVKYGSSVLAFEALKKGKIDLYPEYTGTVESIHLKEEEITGNDEEKQQQIKSLLEKNHKIIALEPLDINNAFRFAITKKVAKEKELKTLSDLEEVGSEWKLGGTTEFIEREDGYKKFQAEYGFSFKGIKSSDSSLRYLALEKEEVNIVQAYLTDAYVVMMNLMLLEDDKNIFKEVQPQILIRKEFAEESQETIKALEKLRAFIDTEDLLELNLLVDEDKEDPSEVAEEYIKKNRIYN